MREHDVVEGPIFAAKRDHKALIGLSLTKIYQGNLKGAKAYLNRLDLDALNRERKKELRGQLLEASKKYIENQPSSLREKAIELSKRPAFDPPKSSAGLRLQAFQPGFAVHCWQ